MGDSVFCKCVTKNNYSKTCVKGPLSKIQKMVFKANYRLMQVKSIPEHSAILSTFIKLPFVIMLFVLSIFDWPFYTGFTVVISIWHYFLYAGIRSYGNEAG